MILPDIYEHYCPTKIVSGQLAISNMPFEMDRMGNKRSMVVMDSSLRNSLVFRKVQQAMLDSDLEIGYVFSDIKSNSASLRNARKVADLFEKNGCDNFLVIGSGWALNVAKAANVLVSGVTDDLKQVAGMNKIKQNLKNIVVVPFQFADGYPVTDAFRILDEEAGSEILVKSEQLYPRMVVLDNKAHINVDSKTVALHGLDIMATALSGYLASTNPVVTIYASAALELLRKYLVPAVKDLKNAEAHRALANAAIYAGIAFSNEMQGTMQALAFAARTRCSATPAEIKVALLKQVIEYEAGRQPEAFERLYDIFAGSDAYVDADNKPSAAALLVIRMIDKVLFAADLEISLERLGLAGDQLEDVAKLAAAKGAAYNWDGSLNEGDLLALMKVA